MPQLTRRVIVLWSVLALLVVTAAACGSRLPTGQWFFGDSLAINLQQLQRVPEVRYTEGDKQWVVRPQREGYEIAAAQLSVRNRASSVSILSIGEKSLRLSDAEGTDYDAVNPFGLREETPAGSSPTGGKNPILDKHVPFIWGPVDLPQECMNTATGQMEGCELKGWVLFEIPKGMDLSQLVWESSDVVYIRFE